MSDELIADFIRWKQAGNMSDGTLRLRRNTLASFNRCHDLATATADEIAAYLTRPGRGPAANKSILSTLRTFYRWAVASERLQRDPTVLLHSIREPIGAPRPTPRDRITAALASADEPTTCAILLGYRAGLRIAEISSLHADDVTSEGLRITGKGQRSRIVPIHRDLSGHLAFSGWRFPSPRWPEQHANTDYIRDKITAATGHNPHALRHRFATDVYEATGDLRSLQELMGHSSIQTTQRYVALADRRLRAAVDALV